MNYNYTKKYNNLLTTNLPYKQITMHYSKIYNNLLTTNLPYEQINIVCNEYYKILKNDNIRKHYYYELNQYINLPDLNNIIINYIGPNEKYYNYRLRRSNKTDFSGNNISHELYYDMTIQLHKFDLRNLKKINSMFNLNLTINDMSDVFVWKRCDDFYSDIKNGGYTWNVDKNIWVYIEIPNNDFKWKYEWDYGSEQWIYNPYTWRYGERYYPLLYYYTMVYGMANLQYSN
jgi:hypothetical protein